jgi:hypothetical protein
MSTPEKPDLESPASKLEALIQQAAAALASLEENSKAAKSAAVSATEAQTRVSEAVTDSLAKYQQIAEVSERAANSMTGISEVEASIEKQALNVAAAVSLATEAQAKLQEVIAAAAQVASARKEVTDSQTVIDQHARSAAAAIASAKDAQTQTGSAMAEAHAKLQEIIAVATQAAAAKAQITDGQAVIATKSDHIDGAQKHADKVRGDLDRALTSAQASLTETEGVKTRTIALADSVAQAQAAVTAGKADVDANADAVRKALANAVASSTATKKLADKADQTEETLSAYESRLADLERKCNEQLATIVALLPGATSAGLASAFDERRQTFLEPGKRWQWWFVGSVIALILLSLSGLAQLYLGTDVLTYEKLLRVWLARLPVAAALVWLALYTSREASLAKRLEEDYGYKSAIAASFQGFQKQMQEIAATVSADSPLGKLCHDTLIAIASPPGRIYDKHSLTVSPSSEIKELAAAVAETVAKAFGKSPEGGSSTTH